MILLVTICLVLSSIFLFKYIFNPFVIGILFAIVALVVMPLIRNPLMDSDNYYLTDIIILIYLISYFLGIVSKTPKITLYIRDKKATFLIAVLIALLLVLPPILYKFLQYPFSVPGFRQFYEESRFEG